jgi:hypothetical protein
MSTASCPPHPVPHLRTSWLEQDRRGWRRRLWRAHWCDLTKILLTFALSAVAVAYGAREHLPLQASIYRPPLSERAAMCNPSRHRVERGRAAGLRTHRQRCPPRITPIVLTQTASRPLVMGGPGWRILLTSKTTTTATRDRVAYSCRCPPSTHRIRPAGAAP